METTVKTKLLIVALLTCLAAVSDKPKKTKIITLTETIYISHACPDDAEGTTSNPHNTWHFGSMDDMKIEVTCSYVEVDDTPDAKTTVTPQ